MAIFRCRTCDKEGTFVYDPDRFTCPLCDSIDVQFEVRIEELPDDDPLRNAAKRLAVARYRQPQWSPRLLFFDCF
jgi:anaerobic ribonucleoside-triphosphate reductase